MKELFRALCFALAFIQNPPHLEAEIFIGPTSETNRLVIAEGQAIVANVISGPGTVRYALTNGTIVPLSLPESLGQGWCDGIAGPAEIIVDQLDSGSTVLSFVRFATTNVHTLPLTSADWKIEVPDGFRLKFFWHAVKGAIPITGNSGGRSFTIRVWGGDQLDGSLLLSGDEDQRTHSSTH